MPRSLLTPLAVLALALTATAGEILSVSPSAGTFGTELFVSVDGQLDGARPKAFLVRASDGQRFKLKMNQWMEQPIEAEIRKRGKLTASAYTLYVQLEDGQLFEGGDFTVMPPRILGVDRATALPGDEVVLTVEHLGTRKAPIKVSGRKAKRLEWIPDAPGQDEGVGQVRIQLPKKKLPSCDAFIQMKSKLGPVVFSGGLEILSDQPPASGSCSTGSGGGAVLGAKFLGIESATHTVFVEPGSTEYTTVIVADLGQVKGKNAVLVFEIELPEIPQVAGAVVVEPTRAFYHLGDDPKEKGFRAWHWQDGAPFQLTGTPVGVDAIHWEVSGKLKALKGKKTLDLAAAFTSTEIGSGTGGPAPPGVSMSVEGVSAPLVPCKDVNQVFSFSLDANEPLTSIYLDICLETATAAYWLELEASRNAALDPVLGPVTFAPGEIHADFYDSELEEEWFTKHDPSTNVSVTIQEVSATQLQATFLGHLPGPGGGTRRVEASVLADKKDWGDSGY